MTATQTRRSPQDEVFAALAALVRRRHLAGESVTTRAEVVEALLRDAAIAALAAERAALAAAPNDTPARWLGNQFDFFTGPRWDRTGHHAGLGKRRAGRYWLIDTSGTTTEVCASVPDVR
jgi:hypothetical protein